MSKERLTGVALGPDAEQLAVERIGEVARPAARLECVGAAIERRALLANEEFPGRFIALGTRAGERKVLEMERPEIRGDLVRGRGGARQRAPGAGGERVGKS